jgi:hypothetical protein
LLDELTDIFETVKRMTPSLRTAERFQFIGKSSLQRKCERARPDVQRESGSTLHSLIPTFGLCPTVDLVRRKRLEEFDAAVLFEKAAKVIKRFDWIVMS